MRLFQAPAIRVGSRVLAMAAMAALTAAPARAQQPDTEVMMRWAGADVIGYHIVGVYQGNRTSPPTGRARPT